MNYTRLTKGVYYFDNVLSDGMHQTIHNTIMNEPFSLTSRPGSVEIFESKNIFLIGVFMMMRESIFNYIYADDTDISNGFYYNPSQIDFLNILAKGPQHKGMSHFHTDNNDKLQFSIIYYPHLAWNDSWDGELRIGNKFTIHPNPNSAVVFPSHIPHCIQPVNESAESWRLTCFFRISNTVSGWNNLSLDLISGAFENKGD